MNNKEPFRQFLAEEPVKPEIVIGDDELNKKNIAQYKFDCNFYNKHLKAYLKGQNRFTYGFDQVQLEKGIKTPAYFLVQQKYIKQD